MPERRSAEESDIEGCGRARQPLKIPGTPILLTGERPTKTDRNFLVSHLDRYALRRVAQKCLEIRNVLGGENHHVFDHAAGPSRPDQRTGKPGPLVRPD